MPCNFIKVSLVRVGNANYTHAEVCADTAQRKTFALRKLVAYLRSNAAKSVVPIR